MTMMVEWFIKSANPTNAAKARIRLVLINFLMGFPVQRIWFYMKILRNLPKFNPLDYSRSRPLDIEGPEDDVVRGGHDLVALLSLGLIMFCLRVWLTCRRKHRSSWSSFVKAHVLCSPVSDDSFVNRGKRPTVFISTCTIVTGEVLVEKSLVRCRGRE